MVNGWPAGRTDLKAMSPELSLKSDDGVSVIFVSSAAQAIADAADGKAVSIKIETLDPEKLEIPADQAEEIQKAVDEGAIIVDLSLVDADGNKIPFAENGSVTIEIPYTSENGEVPMVYCLMADGTYYAFPATYDPVTQTVRFTVGEQNTTPVTGTIGDVNLDGNVDALDASQILMYAAAKGAGEDAPLYSAENTASEQTALANADVDGNGTIDAVDAANILMYSAIAGAEGSADWNDVLAKPEESAT